MSLTDTEKRLITQSFTKIASMTDKAAALFYDRLFEIAPDVKPLFKNADMRDQGRKFMQTLATTVASIGRLDHIEPALKELGHRHIMYGVKAKHYELVGQALLWTLEQGLGTDYTDEIEQAWRKPARQRFSW